MVVHVLLAGHLRAQEEPKTLFQSSGNRIQTFFFSSGLKVHFHGSRMEETASPLLGASLGIILDRKFIVGVSGWGKVVRTTFYGHYIQRRNGMTTEIPHQKMAVGYGYGGLLLGAILQSNKPLHVTITSLFGAGSSNEYIIEADGDHGTTFNSPGFAVIEPMVNLELNLTKKLRAAFGVGYRWIGAGKFEQLSSADLSGLTCQVALQLGKY